MQKLLIVLENTPVVVSYLSLEDKLIGVTVAGDYLLLATMQSVPVEKPKQKRRRKIDPQAEGNGETPRKRGRPALGRSPLALTRTVEADAS